MIFASTSRSQPPPPLTPSPPPIHWCPAPPPRHPMVGGARPPWCTPSSTETTPELPFTPLMLNPRSIWLEHCRSAAADPPPPTQNPKMGCANRGGARCTTRHRFLSSKLPQSLPALLSSAREHRSTLPALGPHGSSRSELGQKPNPIGL